MFQWHSSHMEMILVLVLPAVFMGVFISLVNLLLSRVRRSRMQREARRGFEVLPPPQA